MSTPSLTAVGALPVCTSAAFLAKTAALVAFRLAEIPVARTNRRYVSAAGSDSADGLTTATPWLTRAKANAYLAAGPADARISFRRGDIFRDWLTTNYSGLTQGTTAATTVTLTNPPVQTLYPGQVVSLTGGAGATETATIMSYTPSTGVVLLLGSLALDHTALAGYTITAATSARVTVSTLTFAALPAAICGNIYPGLFAGSNVSFQSSDYWQVIGNYNLTTGVVTMTTLLANNNTSFSTCVPSYLRILSSYVTIDDYSDGTAGHTGSSPEPVLSGFGFIPPGNIVGTMSSSDWALTTAPSQTSGAVYEHILSYGGSLYGIPAALRAVGDIVNPPTLMGNFADCDAVPGSWWYDLAAKKIYLHAATGAPAPNSSSSPRYEATYRNNVSAIFVEDVDGVRLRNLTIEGHGANAPASQLQPGYSVMSKCSGTNAILYDNIKSFYAGRHALGNVIDGAGGIATYAGCVTGCLTGDGGNVVTYAGGGGQEHLSVNCRAASGRLMFGRYSPYGNTGFGGVGVGVFGHTGGGTTYIGLFLDIGSVNTPGQMQIAAPTGPNNTAPFADLVNCKAFVIGQQFSARQPTAFDAAAPSQYGDGGAANGTNAGQMTLGGPQGSANTAYINCRIASAVLCYNAPIGDVTAASSDSGGVHINGDYTFDFSGAKATNGNKSVWNVQNTASPLQAYHTRFVLGGATGNAYYLYRNAGNASTVFKDCIFGLLEGAGSTGNTFLLNCGNLAANLVNNAYSDVTTATGQGGYSNDPYGVAATGLAGALPLPGSPLQSANEQPVMGYTLEYDALGSLRPSANPCIGPYEPLSGVLTPGATKRRMQ